MLDGGIEVGNNGDGIVFVLALPGGRKREDANEETKEGKDRNE